MAMKRCPDCGEKYSDTYKYCPFCEEEEALRRGERPGRRRGGRRVAGGGSPNILSPILVVIILILAALLIYLFFGESIAKRFSGGAQPGGAVSSGAVSGSASGSAAGSASGSADDPGIVEPGISGSSSSGAASSVQTEPELSYETAAALPKTLTLSTEDFSLFLVGESHTINVSGGSGNYQWFSEDEGVASVDENGKVTAISRGDIHVVVTDGTGQGSCVVRVKISESAGTTTPAHTPSTGAKLSSEDFTLSVGDPDVKLTVSGVTTQITWTSKDPSVATVSSNGVVKAVGKGTTTVTATFDGTTLSCIVRVPR